MWARTDPDPAAAPQLSDAPQLLDAPATGAVADAVTLVVFCVEGMEAGFRAGFRGSGVHTKPSYEELARFAWFWGYKPVQDDRNDFIRGCSLKVGAGGFWRSQG